MSGITEAFLAAGALLVVAGFIALRTRRTRRTRRTPVVWMREADSRIAHAFRKVELRAKASEVDSAGLCGPWPVAELVRDDGARRCAACVREVEKLERGGT